MELRVNDFETVRDALRLLWSQEDDGMEADGGRALAALDRIEAEVERLRAALREIAHDPPTTYEGVQEFARNALAEEKV